MKKITGLCIVLSLTFFVACGQKKQDAKPTTPQPVISVADIASLAVIHRNLKKECVPGAELALLRLLRDADAEVSNSVGYSNSQSNPNSKTPTYSVMAMAKICPCPPNYCTCDSTKTVIRYVVMKSWNVSSFQLVREKSKNMDNPKIEEIPGQNGIIEYKLPAKLEDGDYTFIITGTFGGSVASETFELPASIHKGKMYFLK